MIFVVWRNVSKENTLDVRSMVILRETNARSTLLHIRGLAHAHVRAEKILNTNLLIKQDI